MKDLHCIVYTSSAVRLLNHDQIEHLLVRARERNRENDVTGLLLYSEGSFMQYIEGPHDPLMSIYQIILRDSLHHTIIELLNEPADTREFDGWDMAYTRARQHELQPLLEADWHLQKGQSAGSGTSKGRQLLESFWRSQNRYSTPAAQRRPGPAKS